MSNVAYLSVEERRALGKAGRERAQLSDHAGWAPAENRFDPIALIEAEDASREADLVPVRHGRMMASPFTFYRGVANIMAADLKDTPTAGLDAQLCGDAHLSNFGLYGSPERTLLFDVNDFDETLPGPFEYDVKRMATSFTIAARNNGFGKGESRAATRTSVMSYREAMAEFAAMRTMDIWYAHLSEHDLMAAVDTEARARKLTNKQRARAGRPTKDTLRKARGRDSLHALGKLAEMVDGKYRIVSQPPVVIPFRELGPQRGMSPEEIKATIDSQFEAYRATLPDHRRHLLDHFKVVDVARKVVGVGSVGTWAFIVLLQGRDERDPLFLQVKQASESVLEDHLPKSIYSHAGERVVQGQHLMQAAPDVYLGWTSGAVAGQLYWRQLRDMKGSAVVEAMQPDTLAFYARLCGRTLARAHARSGDPVALSAYLGKKDRFEVSITEFAERYADQNSQDYEAYREAIRSGRLQAIEGV